MIKKESRTFTNKKNYMRRTISDGETRIWFYIDKEADLDTNVKMHELYTKWSMDAFSKYRYSDYYLQMVNEVFLPNIQRYISENGLTEEWVNFTLATGVNTGDTLMIESIRDYDGKIETKLRIFRV